MSDLKVFFLQMQTYERRLAAEMYRSLRGTGSSYVVIDNEVTVAEIGSPLRLLALVHSMIDIEEISKLSDSKLRPRLLPKARGKKAKKSASPIRDIGTINDAGVPSSTAEQYGLKRRVDPVELAAAIRAAKDVPPAAEAPEGRADDRAAEEFRRSIEEPDIVIPLDPEITSVKVHDIKTEYGGVIDASILDEYIEPKKLGVWHVFIVDGNTLHIAKANSVTLLGLCLLHHGDLPALAAKTGELNLHKQETKAAYPLHGYLTMHGDIHERTQIGSSALLEQILRFLRDPAVRDQARFF
jgi:hypothetical protein